MSMVGAGMDIVGWDEMENMLGGVGCPPRAAGVPCPPQAPPATPEEAVRRCCNLLYQRTIAHKMNLAAMAGVLPQIFLGVLSGTVAAAGTEAIPAEPNVRFRITDFIVDDAIANDFRITAIQIGRLNLLTSNVGIPASMFRTSVQRPPIETPILEAGTQAVVTVLNTSGADRIFSASFIALDLTKIDQAYRSLPGM